MTTSKYLINQIECHINQAFRKFTADIWKEDSISSTVIIGVRTAINSARTMQFCGETASVEAEVFKASGTLENRFGDIAVIVNLHFRDGAALCGVAMYEAKKRQWNGTSLPAINTKQLMKIKKNSPGAHLLVYDYDQRAMTWADDLESPFSWHGHEGLNLLPTSQVFSVPIAPLPALTPKRKLDISILKLSNPFSHQLVLRNFRGLDLDHDEKIVAQARGFAEERACAMLRFGGGYSVGSGRNRTTEVE